MWTTNFQMFKLGLEKTEEPELKLPKNCGQFLKRWNIRSFYLSCEKPVLRSRSNRTGHEAMVWFKTRKDICQGCILSPYLFNLYVEYIIWNVRLVKSQDGIKICKRNIKNLRYADDTTLMADSEEKLKSILMRVKEMNEKVSLKLSSPYVVVILKKKKKPQ